MEGDLTQSAHLRAVWLSLRCLPVNQLPGASSKCHWGAEGTICFRNGRPDVTIHPVETLEDKIRRVTAEEVQVVAYDPMWPLRFEQERQHLLECLPNGMIVRIEHFGSTTVVGLAAKPIVDMVVEVRDAFEAKAVVPRILEPQGYDCFWRPTLGDDTPPWYTWCIKRDALGRRTHHLHVGEVGFKTDELRFRDILRTCPEVAAAYQELKLRLAGDHQADRVAYTKAKGDFIQSILRGVASW